MTTYCPVDRCHESTPVPMIVLADMDPAVTIHPCEEHVGTVARNFMDELGPDAVGVFIAGDELDAEEVRAL